MTIEFLTISSRFPEWLRELDSDYKTKIGYWHSCRTTMLKSPSHGRESSSVKIESEAKLILRQLADSDFVILCDEQGLSFSSLKFAKKIESLLNTGKKRLVFVIGGAYGVGDKVKNRAEMKLKLSDFTLNHYLAFATLQEQVYRAMTIMKGIQYHNA